MVGDPRHHIFQRLAGRFPITAADFIDALGNRDQQQGIGNLLGCFSELLGKGELGIKGSSRQISCADQVAGIGHPLIDQDQTRAVGFKQLGKGASPWGDLLFVAGFDLGVTLFASELPCQFTPEGVHLSAVWFEVNFRGIEGRSHEHRP